jgi:GT2 family glycosyltransferase
MQTHHRPPLLRFFERASTAASSRAAPRVTVIVMTREQPQGLAGVLQQLRQLPEQPRLIVLDNASCHAAAVAQVARLHGADLVRCEHHLGTSAFNQVVARVTTPHVAFCDASTWWSDGALKRACDILDEFPHIGAINGRVLVGSNEDEHDCCTRMQHSTLDNAGLPGPALLSFMSNAVVIRTRAFRHAGGYEPQAFCGAEDALIGLSLAALGWRMVYVPDVTLHQLSCTRAKAPPSPILILRNRLWVAWLRLPWRDAWRETRAVLSDAWQAGQLWPVLWRSLQPFSWLLLNRRAVPDLVAEMHRTASSSAATSDPARAPSRPLPKQAPGRPTNNMPSC